MTQIVTLFLPWIDAADQLMYQAMKLSGDTIGKRVARRAIRKWYKQAIGRHIDKRTMEAIWKKRHTTRALTEHEINMRFQEMAVASYKELTNSCAEEETC